MHAIADTEKLVADGVIDARQAREIEHRAREAMVALGINAVLCFGIVAATAGTIFWLADALSVALLGALALAGGLAILVRGGQMYRMFGNAAALIGAGLLIGGGTFELIDRHEQTAGWVMLACGALIASGAGAALVRGALTARFVSGAVLLMGVALHLGGLAVLLAMHEVSGLPVGLSYLYASVVIAAAGVLCDVRLITALAIVPFAQALDTGTFYFHAAYVFYSPEPTLSILQMALLVGLALWAARRLPERYARHARILAVMGFVVANLCALVASLWGDVVGETIWGPGRASASGMSWEEFGAATEAFRQTALVIPADLYSVLWALALVAIILAAAHRADRGIFNAALSFAGIHAYTQLFESFGDESLVWVVGGLAAIPLAWGTWRLNRWMAGLQRAGAAEGG